MTETPNKLSLGFWIISVGALLWNLMGVGVFAMHAMMTPEVLANTPEAYQAQYAVFPSWYTFVFGMAVIGGAVGCIGLVLRKKWALILFVLSLLGILMQQLVFWVLTDIGKSLDGFNLVMTLMIPAVAIFLIWFTRKKTTAGWLV